MSVTSETFRPILGICQRVEERNGNRILLNVKPQTTAFFLPRAVRQVIKSFLLQIRFGCIYVGVPYSSFWDVFSTVQSSPQPEIF